MITDDYDNSDSDGVNDESIAITIITTDIFITIILTTTAVKEILIMIKTVITRIVMITTVITILAYGDSSSTNNDHKSSREVLYRNELCK